MNYSEFIKEFNECCRFVCRLNGSEANECYAKKDQGIKIFCRNNLIAKLHSNNNYWEFQGYSTFSCGALKLMAELAETEPKLRDDTLWVLMNGKPYITEGGLVCYQFFRKSKYGYYLESHLATSYEMLKKLAPYNTFELEKLKEKCAPDLGRAIDLLAVELDKVENIDEDY